jgi:hypothetical protein
LRAAKAKHQELYARLTEANRRVNEARQALAACNRERCVSGVELSKAIGVLGNNPFDPPNPTGTTVVTGGAPPSGGIGSLQFNSATYGGAEGGAVLVTVVRSGGSKGNVSVQYATVDAAAKAGFDYTAASGTLAWRDGESTSKSFSIALATDSEVEQVETFNVVLSSPGGGATLGSPSTATVSITDTGASSPQPAGTLQFAQSAYSVAENAGSVSISVTRSGGSAGAVSVQYFTGPGSALAGSDYQQANGVLSWGSGETGAKTFTVPIINDSHARGRRGLLRHVERTHRRRHARRAFHREHHDRRRRRGLRALRRDGQCVDAERRHVHVHRQLRAEQPAGALGQRRRRLDHAIPPGGTATFQGCGPVAQLDAQRPALLPAVQPLRDDLAQRQHRLQRERAQRHGSCGFTCTKTSP